MKKELEELNSHIPMKQYITLPTWTDICKLDIPELTAVREKIERYNLVLSRIIRERLSR